MHYEVNYLVAFVDEVHLHVCCMLHACLYVVKLIGKVLLKCKYRH